MKTECCSSPAVSDSVQANFHTALNVSDLQRSIAFYRVLFDLEPAKSRADYAKFELSEPPLVLSLVPGRAAAGGMLNHFGLRVADAETLVGIQRRLETAGIPTKREEGVECCYARQTKFWVADPDHTFWEIYVFHEDLDEHGDDHLPAIEQLDPGAATSSRLRVLWQHAIGQPVPAKIPHADYSVDEVLLEGTANLLPAQANLPALLAEAFRVLRPGGEVRIRGLTGDAKLEVQLPPLPGPAAVVEHVPAHRDLVSALRNAGFSNLRLETLSSTAHFTVGGVSLREIRIAGTKPGHRPQTATCTAIYLGPFAQVTDDFGNTFHPGEPTALNIHDWQALANGPNAENFLLLRGAKK